MEFYISLIAIRADYCNEQFAQKAGYIRSDGNREGYLVYLDGINHIRWMPEEEFKSKFRKIDENRTPAEYLDRGYVIASFCRN